VFFQSPPVFRRLSEVNFWIATATEVQEQIIH